MLYGPNGQSVSSVHITNTRPEPQPEAETRVREQLKSIDSLLDVRWFPYAIINPVTNEWEGRYALVCNWPQSDKRWEMYQSGEIEDHCDMLGWFCEDIHDAKSIPVNVDSIEQKIVELLGKCDANRIPHATRLKQIVEKNAKNRKNRKQPMLDYTQEIAETLHHAVRTKKTATVERMLRELGERSE